MCSNATLDKIKKGLEFHRYWRISLGLYISLKRTSTIISKSQI